jgi:hypothetical protein
MRNFCAALIACSIISTSAFAADADGALSPGRPAGVKQAQMTEHATLWIVGLGLVAAGIAIAASSSGGNHNSGAPGGGTTTTTTTTSP